MKKVLFSILLAVIALAAQAQMPGFGQNMQKADFQDVNYAGDDLEAHRLDIYIPKNTQSKPKVIIAIYGSAWFSNNMKGMTFMSIGRPLYEAGFAVVCINHRSSGDSKFPAQIQDVKGAIRFIRANADKYGLDTSFIGITGFSSGGHLSALAGVTNGVKTKTIGNVTVDIEGNVGGNTNFSSDVDAVVDWFGPVDMSRMEDCSRVKDANSPEAALIGGDPAKMPEMVSLISPITYVNKSCPRFIVVHGEADNVVPHCQGEFFSAELQKNGRLEEFISVPNGQHGPVTFNDNTYKKMTDFFLKESGKTTGNPLFVVNGKVFSPDTTIGNVLNEEEFAKLLHVNPEDIESITVLKDDAATAVWGSQGANGIIEIKTKNSVSTITESMKAEDIMQALKECGVFFIATVDGDQPHVRPFGALAVYEGKLYIQTGKSKNVFKQMAANGKFEICAMKKSGSEWIRITGKLVNDDRLAAKEHMLNENPGLKSMYKADDSNTAVLYVTDGVATFNSFSGSPRTVKF